MIFMLKKRYQLYKVVSDEIERPALNKILIEKKDKHNFWAIATNGHILARVDLKDVVSGEGENSMSLTSILIDPQVIKLSTRNKTSHLTNRIVVNDNHSFIEDEPSVKYEHSDDKFPRYELALVDWDGEKEKGRVVTFGIDAELLLKLSEAIGNDKGEHRLKLELILEDSGIVKRPIRVQSADPSRRDGELGIIMPVRID